MMTEISPKQVNLKQGDSGTFDISLVPMAAQAKTASGGNKSGLLEASKKKGS